MNLFPLISLLKLFELLRGRSKGTTRLCQNWQNQQLETAKPAGAKPKRPTQRFQLKLQDCSYSQHPDQRGRWQARGEEEVL